jgi:hypothetical protein
MISQKKSYVYRLMKVTCSCGGMVGDGFLGSALFAKNKRAFEQNLNAVHDHGVYLHDFESPLLNANDHLKDENISTFGRCMSNDNPRGYIATMLLISPLMGPFIRQAIGCVCDPVTLVPWVYVDDDYFIDGAPALTIESELPCLWGGSIKIVAKLEDADSAQATAESEASSSDSASSAEGGEGGEGGGAAAPADIDRRDLLPSEVQEKIDSFCDSEMSNPTSRADEELANEAQGLYSKIENSCNDCISTSGQELTGGFEIDFTLPWGNGMSVRGVEHDGNRHHMPGRPGDPDFSWESIR